MIDRRTEIIDIFLHGKILRISALWENWAITRISLELAEHLEHSGFSPLAEQLDELLSNRIKQADLPFVIKGTPFQHSVWNYVSEIPYGEVRTYGQLAEAIGCGAPIAVGQALKANRLPILIPCHRVVGKGGRLTGFSAGLEIKELLLEHEKGLPLRWDYRAPLVL